mmetsp:Transcript_22561/g.62614  ORF Transcript_22561/g.62614 Transcript_22561/m.62614 type:complete len:250 (-) Transcript_22561:1553-2302(-)
MGETTLCLCSSSIRQSCQRRGAVLVMVVVVQGARGISPCCRLLRWSHGSDTPSGFLAPCTHIAVGGTAIGLLLNRTVSATVVVLLLLLPAITLLLPARGAILPPLPALGALVLRVVVAVELVVVLVLLAVHVTVIVLPVAISIHVRHIPVALSCLHLPFRPLLLPIVSPLRCSLLSAVVVVTAVVIAAGSGGGTVFACAVGIQGDAAVSLEVGRPWGLVVFHWCVLTRRRGTRGGLGRRQLRKKFGGRP